MSTVTVDEILEEYSKRPYVESTVLLSTVGVPIASNEPKLTELDVYAPLVSITYEGAHELANNTGQSFKQLNVELSNGSRIIVKPLREKFLLAVTVDRYDDSVRDEIEHLGEKVSEQISNQ